MSTKIIRTKWEKQTDGTSGATYVGTRKGITIGQVEYCPDEMPCPYYATAGLGIFPKDEVAKGVFSKLDEAKRWVTRTFTKEKEPKLC